MLTADPASDPRPSHVVNVVDNSTHVKRESHLNGIYIHAHRNESQYAMDCSTEGFDALRDLDEAPFAVTLGGRTVMVAPVPPALPQQIIPSYFPWPAADMARPVHPAIEVMQ